MHCCISNDLGIIFFHDISKYFMLVILVNHTLIICPFILRKFQLGVDMFSAFIVILEIINFPIIIFLLLAD